MRYLLVIFSSILIISCEDQPQTPSKYQTERVDFISKNIYGFENMFGEALNSQVDQPSFGTLHFPDDYDPKKKYALVIASHGSANWRDHHRKYLEQMRQAGLMVFAMHAFDARNLSLIHI